MTALRRYKPVLYGGFSTRALLCVAAAVPLVSDLYSTLVADPPPTGVAELTWRNIPWWSYDAFAAALVLADTGLAGMIFDHTGCPYLVHRHPAVARHG